MKMKFPEIKKAKPWVHALSKKEYLDKEDIVAERRSRAEWEEFLIAVLCPIADEEWAHPIFEELRRQAKIDRGEINDE